MSKKPIIGQNLTTPWTDTVGALKTNDLSGGTTEWVPEDEARADRLTVTQNGTYSAASAGKYGYSYVIVSVPGSSVTGIDPSTGNEVEVDVDPNTGEIVETVIPSSIRITTPPTKLSYTDGDAILFSGLVVHAYDANGEDMGVVPFSELTFPVTMADIDEANEWTDDSGVNAMTLTYAAYTNTYISHGVTRTETVYVGDKSIGTKIMRGEEHSITLGSKNSGDATMLVTKYDGDMYIACIAGEERAVNLYAFYDDEDIGNVQFHGWSLTGGATALPGRNQFYKRWKDNDTTSFSVPESTVDPTQADISAMHDVQVVPVHWARPGDGAVLEATFDITVSAGS